MARIRTIKPEFFTSLTIAGLPLEARLTFIGLWTHVDDAGRCVDDTRLVRAALWPLDDRTLDDVGGDLKKLEAVNLIVRYTVDDRGYIAVVGWAEHQRINRPTPSKYPSPEVARAGSIGALTSIDGRLTEGSVSPHGAISEGSVRAHGGRTEDSRNMAPDGTPSAEPTNPQIPGLTSIDGRLTEGSLRERKGKEGKGSNTPVGGASGESLINGQRVTLDQHWAKFWNTFPRRKEPRTARAAWDKARKRAPIHAIQAGAERYAKEAAGRDLKYFKYPATWLNGDCWADGPEEKAAARDIYGGWGAYYQAAEGQEPDDAGGD